MAALISGDKCRALCADAQVGPAEPSLSIEPLRAGSDVAASSDATALSHCPIRATVFLRLCTLVSRLTASNT